MPASPLLDQRVPSLPPYHQPRQEQLERLKRAMLAGGAMVGLTGRPVAYGMHGMGGIGKTLLAAALCHDGEVQNAFPGGILWWTLGLEPLLVEAQRHFARRLGDARADFADASAGLDALSAKLAETRDACLIVLDDVWQQSHVENLIRVHPPHSLLITTRDGGILRRIGAAEHQLGELTKADALALLERVSDVPQHQFPPAASEIVRECGNLPLAIAIVGTLLRTADRAVWTAVLKALKAAAHEDLLVVNDPVYGRIHHVFAALQVSFDRLNPVEQECLLDTAIFPEDEPIPALLFGQIWQQVNAIQRHSMLNLFVDRNLLRRTSDDFYTQHDLQRDFLRRRAGNSLAARHIRLIRNEELGQNPEAQAAIESYFCRRLPWHLKDANNITPLRGLLLDPGWMIVKLKRIGVAALAADYDLLSESVGMQRIRDTLILASHVLAEDPSQIGSQIVGRLSGEDGEDVATLLNATIAKAPKPWLKPRQSLLVRPDGPLIRTLVGHDDAVTSVSLSNDGRIVASASRDRTVRVWELYNGRQLHAYRGHEGTITAVAISANGCRVAAASLDGQVLVWDVESQDQIASQKGHGAEVQGVSLSADGHRVASCSADRTVRVKETGSFRGSTTVLSGHTSGVRAVAISLDGRRVLSGATDGTLRLWDVETGKTIKEMKGLGDAIHSVALSFDGLTAVSGSESGAVGVWNTRTGQATAVLKGHVGPVNGVALSADAKRAVSGGEDRVVRVWDLESRSSPGMLMAHGGAVTAVAMTTDGTRAISSSEDRTIRVWDLTAVNAQESALGYGEWVKLHALSADGQRAILSSGDKMVRGRSLERGIDLPVLAGFAEKAAAAALSPDGSHALSVSENGTMQVWNVDSGQLQRAFSKSWNLLVTAAALGAAGERAVVGTECGTVRVWNTKETAKTLDLHGHRDAVTAIATSPDRPIVLSGTREGHIRMWDLGDRNKQLNMIGRQPVTALTISPGGRRAVAGSLDGNLRVWDLITGRALRELAGHKGPITAVAVSADGRRLISGSKDRTVRVWLQGATQAHSVYTADADICNVAITPSNVIIAGDSTGRIHVLDLID